MKTWHLEHAAVALVLAIVLVVTKAPWVEVIGALAVLAAFGHMSVTSRMTEAQQAMSVPSVDCWRRATYYWVAKEFLWISYFLLNRSYSALVGCGVFLLYPLWRRYWRSRKASV